MWKLRYYWPLAGFTVASAVVGYCYVLPQSGFGGLNALSLGFGSTLFGAGVTYAMGIAEATRTACPASKPLRVRMNDYINSQAAHPRGLFGRFLAFMWKRQHRTINEATLELLAPQRGDRVLEIGSGPGEALRALASRGCTVVGIDVSEAMVRRARRRNRRIFGHSRVAVRRVEDGKLGLEIDSFDSAFSVHCIYFWKQPVETLRQIFAALRLDGKLVLAFTPNSPLVPQRLRGKSYRFYTPEQVRSLLAEAGFASTDVVWKPGVSDRVVWITGSKT